jgi:hypothetical protein
VAVGGGAAGTPGVPGAAGAGVPGTAGAPAAAAGQWRRHRTPGRTKQPHVRFTPQEYAEISDAARRAGLTPAGYVAEAALAAARNTAPPSQSPARDALVALMGASTQLRRLATNVNQAVKVLHSTGAAPPWLADALAVTMRSVRRVDEAAAEVGRRIR